MSIRLSKKYGLNPCMSLCFFCGEVKEILLLGHIKGDKEAPRQAMVDYHPCDKCQKLFDGNTLIITVTEIAPDHRPPIKDKWYPTGQYVVVHPEWSIEYFGQYKPIVLSEADLHFLQE